MIAEPWDVGMGGWQVGNFPDGWSEWNDGYRDRMRNFWLRDIASERDHRIRRARASDRSPRRLAGSNHVFSLERGPLASVNFITAHDGFTASDLISYDSKHNLGNGENNRDGTNNNKTFNHGVEGPTKDAGILSVRRKAMRNLLGTLLLSAGVPMLTAGDEFGRTQRGNNNAYCHDSELTWLRWDREPWQEELYAVVRQLIKLRRENPALRPVRFGRWGETTPSASQMDWYNADGESMTLEDWDSPAKRTLQYLAASTPEFEEFNRILLVVHGLETEVTVTLPAHTGGRPATPCSGTRADDDLDPDRAAEHYDRATETRRRPDLACCCSAPTDSLRRAQGTSPSNGTASVCRREVTSPARPATPAVGLRRHHAHGVAEAAGPRSSGTVPRSSTAPEASGPRRRATTRSRRRRRARPRLARWP